LQDYHNSHEKRDFSFPDALRFIPAMRREFMGMPPSPALTGRAACVYNFTFGDLLVKVG